MARYIDRVAREIAALITREGLHHLQTKAVFKAARHKAGLAGAQTSGAAPPPGSAWRRNCASSTTPTPAAARSA